MPLPPELDSQIRNRFEELETAAEQLAVRHNMYNMLMGQDIIDYDSGFQKVKTNFLNLIQLLATKKNSFSDLVKDVRNVGPFYPAQLHGMIAGLKEDYERGLLRSIAEMIEANVTTDYLEQAEQLLQVNKKGEYNHVPAAVLACAVLEDSLRRICTRQTPPIPIKKPGGSPKMLNALIDDLRNADVFNELKAKQLRAWADIRNAAAHGQFDELERAEVEVMHDRRYQKLFSGLPVINALGGIECVTSTACATHCCPSSFPVNCG